jgi:hypothetical protein
MTGARHAGRWATLGVLVIAVAGCAPSVRSGDPPALITTTDTAPPVTACSGPVPGTPIAALACRYHGLNDQPPGTLAQSAQLTGADVGQLATDVRAGQPFPSAPGLAMNCPADFGLSDLIVFTYASGGQSDVRVDLTGCGSVYSGRQRLQSSAGLLRDLTSLVGASPSPSN